MDVDPGPSDYPDPGFIWSQLTNREGLPCTASTCLILSLAWAATYARTTWDNNRRYRTAAGWAA